MLGLAYMLLTSAGDAAAAQGHDRRRWAYCAAGPAKRERPDLATVIGFSDGGSFAAGVGPAPAAPEQQGRFADAVSAVVKPAAPRPAPAAEAAASPSSTAAAPGGPSPGFREQAAEEDKAAARKRLAAERFREYMKSHSQKQSSFYDELPPPAAGDSGAVGGGGSGDNVGGEGGSAHPAG